jgi:TonB family protein
MTTLLFSAALKGTLLLAAAWAATALLRKSSADLRHRIWLAALCGLPLLLIPLSLPEAARVEVAYVFTAEATSAAANSAVPLWSVIWAMGAVLFLARFLVGVARLTMLTRGSQQTEIAGVRCSASISTPLTWGVFRPVILLPEYASAWSGEKRAVAVAHERAHVARADWFWQAYAQLVRAIFWFHPLVWLASSRLRREAEEAVDDAVIASGAGADRYAEQLLEVARHMSGANHAAAIAMVRHPELSARITAILDHTRVRTMAGVRSRVAIAVAALCSVPILAAFQSRAPQPVVMPAPRAVAQPILIAQAAPKPVPTQAPAPKPAPGPTEPYPIGDGVSAPKAIFTPEPQYPQEAKDAHVEGAVTLSLVVDENGVPGQVSVTQSLEPTLDAAAVATIEMWRFTPGMKDGRPVAVRATIMVNFKLL